MKTFIVLIGAPGAGKGTQAKILQQQLGLPQVASGDIFRWNLKNNTELGKEIREFMDKGELVPDEVTIAMIRDRLTQDDCEQGAILDGFPRTVQQAEALDALLQELDGEIIIVPYIFVPKDILIKRLLNRAEMEGRADDNEETIAVRMQVFQDQTAPLLDFYNDKGLLQIISGHFEIKDVTRILVEAITLSFEAIVSKHEEASDSGDESD